MTTPASHPELTPDVLVQMFHAALAAGDVRGVEAALKVLAVRDPHRAQELHDALELGLEIAALEEAKNRG